MKALKDLAKLTVYEYTDILGSDNPSPGGGSATALLASLGVALAEMACRLNAKRKKSNADWQTSAENAKRLAKFRKTLLQLVTKDAETFEAIMEHWKDQSPKLQSLLVLAANVPMAISKNIEAAMELATTEIPRTSKYLMSDLAQSGIVLESAMQSAYLNVEVNLRIIKDKSFVTASRKKMKEHLRKSAKFAKVLHEAF